MIAIQMLTVLDARVLQAMYARQIAKEVSLRIFGFGLWAIALLALGFVNGCVNSSQLGRDARRLWNAHNGTEIIETAVIASELVTDELVLQVSAIAVVAWGAIVVHGTKFLRGLPSASNQFIDQYLMGA